MRVASWGWAAVLATGLTLFEIARRVVVATGDPKLIPTLILLGAVTVPAAFVVLIYGRRLDYDVPGAVVAACALLGGVVGVTIAGTLEYDTLRRLGTLPVFAVAVIEETAKLAVPAGFLMFTRYRRLADGLLLGVACGAGFAVLETLGYAFVELTRTNGSLSAADNVLLWRGILSPAAHMAWTGLTSAALWRVVTRPSLRSLGEFVATFVVAVTMHFVWDSYGRLAGYLILAAISLSWLATIAFRLSKPKAPRPACSATARNDDLCSH